MANPLIVSIRIALEEIDPTGEPCEVCTEIPYLAAATMVAYVNGERGDSVVYLCQSCAEVLRDEIGND